VFLNQLVVDDLVFEEVVDDVVFEVVAEDLAADHHVDFLELVVDGEDFGAVAALDVFGDCVQLLHRHDVEEPERVPQFGLVLDLQFVLDQLLQVLLQRGDALHLLVALVLVHLALDFVEQFALEVLELEPLDCLLDLVD